MIRIPSTSLLAAALLTVAVPLLPAQGNEAGFPFQGLDFIGESILPNDTLFEGTPVGGLSGLDYDPATGQWVAICDDRSVIGPARAYLGKLPLTRDHVGPFGIQKVIVFKQQDGSTYPNRALYLIKSQGVVPDLESIRFGPNGKTLRYTSEGDRKLGLNPFIRDAALDGNYIDELPVPEAFKVNQERPEAGFNDNMALEGSSFAPDGKHYFAAMEGPLMQDAPLATANHGAMIRITEYDENGGITAQYAYPLEPLPEQPTNGQFGVNGASEILAVDSGNLLVLERAGISKEDGTFRDVIRIYQACLSGATDINGRECLETGKYRPMLKQLLLDLDDLNLPKLDNVEGMTFGPTLENGQRTLVLISDNNFNPSEITQILAFVIVPVR